MYIVYYSIYYIKNNVIHDTAQGGCHDPQTPPHACIRYCSYTYK